LPLAGQITDASSSGRHRAILASLAKPRSVLALRMTIPFAFIFRRGPRPLPRQARKPPTLRFGDYRHGLGTPAS